MAEGKVYEVKQGDCVSSIAYRHGLYWETIWNHPENESLKDRRDNPGLLFPGDKVVVPDRSARSESGSTDARHRFRRKGVPLQLRIRLLEFDEPLANMEYTLEIDGRIFEGSTDDDGYLEHAIAPDARNGRLLVGPEAIEQALVFGHLDPIRKTEGVQSRLNNLGFSCGESDGDIGPKTESALRRFQRANDLTESGELDDETRAKLKELHGS